MEQAGGRKREKEGRNVEEKEMCNFSRVGSRRGGVLSKLAYTLPGAELRGLQAMSSANMRIMLESGMPILLTAR